MKPGEDYEYPGAGKGEVEVTYPTIYQAVRREGPSRSDSLTLSGASSEGGVESPDIISVKRFQHCLRTLAKRLLFV